MAYSQNVHAQTVTIRANSRHAARTVTRFTFSDGTYRDHPTNGVCLYKGASTNLAAIHTAHRGS